MAPVFNLLWVLSLLPANVAVAQTAPIADVGYAKYRGTQNTTLGVNTFFALKFAEAPVGALRWKAPKPIEDSKNFTTGILDATTAGPSCVQGYPYWILPNPGRPAGSEDCLHLNVVTPSNATSTSKLPVLVNIHGGGYTLGDGNSIQPYALVRHSNNSIIVVNIQYRLGSYGFMGSKKFSRAGGATNLGLLDQRLAIEWVQKHISTFGGDPKKVTIMGGSAGGGSVTSQMILYGGVRKPPFRAAIAEYPWWQQFLRDQQLEKQYNNLLSAANCTNMSCLREMSEDALALATQATYAKGYADEAYGYGNFYYGPSVDGYVIQDLPNEEFKAGHYTKVPLLIDRDQYEGFVFTNQSITTTAEETRDMRVQFQYADDTFMQQLYNLYPASAFNSTVWQRQTWFGDFIINCPTYFVASALTLTGQKVWKLIFNAGSQEHGATGPYLFDINYNSSPSANVTLANIMKDWFISFIIHTDPNTQSWSGVQKPSWLQYQAEANIMDVNYTQVGVLSDRYFDKSERCDFFSENGAIIQNR